MMKRRKFIELIPAVALVLSHTARAQQAVQMRRIGVLMNTAADDPRAQAGLTAFQQVLQQLGWSDGRNVRIDPRWGANDVDRDRRYAAELVALAPDAILAAGTLSVAALQHLTRTLQVVFVDVSDPVGAGLGSETSAFSERTTFTRPSTTCGRAA